MDHRTEFLQSCFVLDTETTHKDAKQAELIELGFCFFLDGGEWKSDNKLYRPDEPIDPEASSINHITDEMVANSPSFRDGVTNYNALLSQFGPTVIRVAHNAVYDQTVLDKYGVDSATRPWLCTFRMAKKLYNNDPTVTLKNLSYLRYRFKLEIPEDKRGAHQADVDAVIAAKLLEYMLTDLEGRGILDPDKSYYEQLMDWYEIPVVIEKMPFGKYKGELLTEVPLSYWKWAVNHLDTLDEDSAHYDADFANSVVAVIEKLMND